MKEVKSTCPACGSSDTNDLPAQPPYDAPEARRCADCGYEDYPGDFVGEADPIPKRRAAVLYHNDADGFGSAFAAWYALNDSHDLFFKPVQYSEPIPYKDLREFAPEQVYILDFSYKAPDLRELMNEFNVVVIDHHDGVVPELAGFADIHIVSVVEGELPILSGVRVLPECAACVLSWLFFNPGQDIPEILLYVEDRDIWKWELEHSKEINAYIGTLPFEFEVWADFYMPLAYDAGKAVLAFQQRQMGMYGDTPMVQVGRFTISAQGSDKVWIATADGEGMECSSDLLEPVISEFYSNHF